MKRLLLLCVALTTALWANVGQADESKPGNIAPQAKASAGSSRPEYPLPGVNDGRMDTQWSATRERSSGEWLQLDWDQPQDVCAVVLDATGPWIQAVDVQVKRQDAWISVGQSGSAEEQMPVYTVVTFKPQHTKAIRFVFDGAGAAFNEVEVYNDPAVAEKLAAEYAQATISVAGDLRGRLMGTVARVKGGSPIVAADVTVRGSTPKGGWNETARTGRNGEFEVPLPLATSGPIQVTATKGDDRTEETFESSDISTRLTPQSAGKASDRVSLDGTWDFAIDPPKEFPSGRLGMNWSPVKVPAHWEMEGFVAESGRGAYRRTFNVPTEWKGKRIKFRADAIYSHAQVWINGQRVGSHDGGFTPFERDITEQAISGEQNEIVILVDARSAASEIDNASFYAYFELAGIWQSIGIFAVDPLHVSHMSVKTDFDRSYRDADLNIELDVDNEQPAASDADVNFHLFDPQGKEVPLQGLSLKVTLGPWERKTVNLKAMVSSPQQWNAEQPRLYRLLAELAGASGGKTAVRQRVGFRVIEVQGRVITINGRPVKYRGVNRLSAHPLMGRAITPEIDRQDVEMIKDANFNFIRNHIGPPHAVSMDYADEIGLYFQNEGPACWADHSDDLSYAPLYEGIMCEYLERDRNHPCVVHWSICNESNYGRLFRLTHAKLKTLDSTRTYGASWADQSLDVDVHHHPITLKRISDTMKSSRPQFFDEVLGTFHGWADLAIFEDIDPGMRDYWITGLPEIERALNAGENQLGANQWAWVDDTFLVPGKGIICWRREQPPIEYMAPIYKMPKRGVVGDVAWGTIDGWRRPRPEYWLSKKLYSPVHIEEKPLAIPEPGKPVEIAVENWNQFADLNQYTCRWTMGDEQGEARAEAPPMNKGTLKIETRRRPRPEDQLSLIFYGERDRLIDGYRLAFKPHEIPTFPNSGEPARIVEKNNSLDLNGAVAIRLLGPKVELSYDRASGDLYSAMADRETIMTSGPKLHIQKSKAPSLEYPVGSARRIGMAFGREDVPGDSVWKLTGDEHKIEGSQAVLHWNGKYGSDFDGGFEIRMDNAGDAEFRYTFAYHGQDVWVREIGLDFEFPLDFDRLSWERRAEYSYYPEDHIGRPVGQAIAHPAVAQTVPPGDRPYGLDDHPLGSNDFRSAKRNIYTASLCNAKGEGVRIFSDGTQHVRATVGAHEIHLKVLDYYGGMSWTYHEGYHYGPGRLVRTGEVLSGTVKLKLIVETPKAAAAVK